MNKNIIPKENQLFENKKIIFRLNLVILTVLMLCLFFIGEVLYRTYHKFAKKIPFTWSLELLLDPELGWKGKKIFGDIASNKYKIFVVGDSFTDGCGVKEEKLYYNVMGNRLGAELFVYGGSGYGTLQEYMVLDRYFDEIKPDLVILQVCENDFINNSWKLEKTSFLNNNVSIRPYLKGDRIEYLFPSRLGKVRAFLTTHSRLFYSLFNRIDMLCAILSEKGLLYTIEHDIRDRGMELDEVKNAVMVTNDLIAKMKKRVGQTKIVAFNSYDRYISDNANELFRKIFQNNTIEFVAEIPNIIRLEENRGIRVRISDNAHWNENGHRICGEVLIQKLYELDRKGYISLP